MPNGYNRPRDEFSCTGTLADGRLCPLKAVKDGLCTKHYKKLVGHDIESFYRFQGRLLTFAQLREVDTEETVQYSTQVCMLCLGEWGETDGDAGLLPCPRKNSIGERKQMKTSEDRANEWMRNYVGSIDATALMLAFKAGFEAGCDEAARVAVRPIRGGHSPEAYAVGEHAVETQRAILDLKGPQYLPPRRLR